MGPSRRWLALPLALLLGCGGGNSASSGAASAASPAFVAGGAFVADGAMRSPRAQHTATLLADGRVLVVGGTDGAGVLADAELYDPLTGTWDLVRALHDDPARGLMMDPRGRVPTARQLHSATRLLDGRVLIAGGIGIERADPRGMPVLETLRSAYVFEPASNTFRPVGSLTTPRAWHEALLLSDGRVLLVGGLDASLRATATAEVFDPRSETFTPLALSDVRAWGSAVALGGDALVVGGADVGQAAGGGWTVQRFPATNAERFAGASGRFGPIAGPGQGRVLAAAARTSWGALVVGGQVPQGERLAATTSTLRYDLAQGSFVPGPSLATARFGAEAVVAGGSVLVLGGLDADGAPLASCELYDPARDAFVPFASLLNPRSDFAAVRLRDGSVLVVGGFGPEGAALSATERLR
ncbi:MAG: hypothetical protein D6731_18305 [Planctomycetota bacterium]|nr:MAG: hypothetical protein D6731_18305 [Planctomycetota bacterium]